MLQDLQFSEAVYGLGAGIFFIGYFLFEVPSNLLLEKIGARKTLARITILWGLASMAMIFVKTPMQFYTLRFVLGVFEAGFFPGVVLYLTYWFPAARRARINGLFMTSFAIAGVVGGPLAGFIMSAMDGVDGLANWQWLFVIEGIPSVLAGIAVLMYLPEKPVNAKWLTQQEQTIVTRDVEAEARDPAKHSSLKDAFANARVDLRGDLLLRRQRQRHHRILVAVDHQGARRTGQPADRSGLRNPVRGRHHRHGPQRYSLGPHRRTPHALRDGNAGGSRGPDADRLPASQRSAGPDRADDRLHRHPGRLPGVLVAAVGIPAGTAAAGGIALINSIGNLAGFVAPYMIGWFKTSTGQLAGGLYFVAALEACATVLVIAFIRARH
jgi:hypothetical protein